MLGTFALKELTKKVWFVIKIFVAADKLNVQTFENKAQ